MWQVTIAFLNRLMASLIRPAAAGTAGPLAAAWVGLYQQGTQSPTQNTVLEDLVEASYNGYSRQEATWFPPWTGAGGAVTLAGQDVFFSPTAIGVSNNILGVFIADAFYGGNLWMAAPLAAPGVILASPAQALKVQPVYSQGWLPVYGGPQVVS